MSSEVYNYNKRLSVLLLVMLVITAVTVSKLFYLQIFKYDHYMDIALANHQGYLELEPRRGEVYVQDLHSGEDYRVATNITLDTVFADPSLVKDPILVGEKLTPFLFNESDSLKVEEERIKEERKQLPDDLTEEELNEILKPKSIDTLRDEFKDELITKLGQKTRQAVVLVSSPNNDLVKEINLLGLPAVEASEEGVLLYPPRVSDPVEYARKLSEVLDITLGRLQNLARGQNKYVVLARKLDHQSSENLKDMISKEKDTFKGVGFEENTYRYYPENDLASQIVGFMNGESGQYGMELFYEDILRGEKGLFRAQVDGLGNQITVGDNTAIKPAVDGANVYLTIDRSIQKKVQDILAGYVESFDANAGQVIVVNPKNGEIMAMANYPYFNPNEYWNVGEKEEFEFPVYTEEELPEEELDKVGQRKGEVVRYDYNTGQEVFYEEEGKVYRELPLIPVIDENKEYDPEDPEANVLYYDKFVNDWGVGVYRNRSIVDVYEPGSVFKPIAMAAAIDTDSVTPNTIVDDSGPITLDGFTIGNSNGKHRGPITMTQVLEYSNNIGMAWVADTIGRRLFHSYIERFGFGQFSEVDFESEQKGKVRKPNTWADSELATISFGQGLTVTPLQMVMSYAALANDGVLMKPKLVKRIDHGDGFVEEIEPVVVRRAVSKKTADTLTAMLVSVVDRGSGFNVDVEGYTIAGKTGTAQTYKNGKPLEGPGTTNASFIGYGPAEDPEFVILVRLEKPRTSQWGGKTAVPVFNDVARFLFDYLGVVPS